MDVTQQIKKYIESLPPKKMDDLHILHLRILQAFPNCKLWFLDGKDANGKIVANPNIGYGSQTIQYANGNSKEFYQVGISANSTGISVYIMGLESKAYLPNTYADSIGKASVTSYCIKFKALDVINLQVLDAAIKDGFEQKNLKLKQ